MGRILKVLSIMTVIGGAVWFWTVLTGIRNQTEAELALKPRSRVIDASNGLQEYLSEPLDSSGRRIAVVLPIDWEIATFSPSGSQATRTPKLKHAFLIAVPKRSEPLGAIERHLPESMRKRRTRSTGADYLQAQILPYPTHKPYMPSGKERLQTWKPYHRIVSHREWVSADGRTVFTLRYQRHDASAFHRTHNRISHGFHLR